MRRLFLFTALLLTLALPAQAAVILTFGQLGGGNLFTGNETAGTTVLDANLIPVNITTLDENAVSINAFFSLDATSTALAVNQGGGIYTQTYTGTFSITNGGFNYLSGIFSGVDLGILGGSTMVLGATQPPGSLVFTSDVVGMELNTPRAMAIALTNVFPGVFLSNGSFADFTAAAAGNFSAGPQSDVPEVPEPATMTMLGTGLAALYARRRAAKRKAQSIQ
jgi:hypothetical protein